MPRLRLTALVLLGLACPALVASPAEARTRKPECKPGYQWTSSSPGFATAFSRPFENGGSETQTQSVAVTKSRTVTRRITAGVESSVEGGFVTVKASIKAQFTVEVQKQYTTSTNITDTIRVPPRTRVTYRYGAFTRRLKGMVLGADENVNGPLPIKGCPYTLLRRVTATIPTGESGVRITQRRLKR